MVAGMTELVARTDILVKYIFELRRTNYRLKKDSPAYCHKINERLNGEKK